MKLLLMTLVMCMLSSMQAAENFDDFKRKLNAASLQDQNYFNYPLNIALYQGKTADEDVLLILHGYGSNHQLAEILQTYKQIPDHMISFDFPDHDIFQRQMSIDKTTFGTIQEILPVIYLLKKLAVDAKVPNINVYGFSAGGGALVNALAVLNTTKYDAQLQNRGITKQDKVAILKAVSRGWVLLDAPLKSMEEIMDHENNLMVERFRKNDLRPIDSLKKLKGLKLNVIVYFETPDEVLSNREDDLYANLLRQNNPEGTNIIIKKSSGGHTGYHAPLWQSYEAEKKLHTQSS